MSLKFNQELFAKTIQSIIKFEDCETFCMKYCFFTLKENISHT